MERDSGGMRDPYVVITTHMDRAHRHEEFREPLAGQCGRQLSERHDVGQLELLVYDMQVHLRI